MNYRILSLLFILGILSVYGVSHAQSSPEFLVSWRAHTYVPSTYQGKILPVRGSRITAGVSLAEGNRLADISRSEIRWYLNGRLVQSGIGLQQATINLPATSNADNQLQIIVDYKGNELEKTIQIPIANPKITITTSSPSYALQLSNLLSAVPYFFNAVTINDFIFTWTVNGDTILNTVPQPNYLTLQLEPSSNQSIPFLVNAYVQNRLNPQETASRRINITTQ